MTRTIVVPLDGSEYATRALPIAGWLADRLGAGLNLIMTTFDADTSADTAYLDEQAATMKRDDVQVDLRRNVFAARAIVDAVDARPEAALCMTTRGRGRVAQVLLGSVCDEVVREATAPVVLVGPACTRSAVSEAEIVVCLDDSHGSTTLLPVVAEWADRLGLVVHLLAVDPTGIADDPGNGASAELLEESARIIEDQGVHCETHLLRSSHPADAITAFAAARDAALIALSSGGHSGGSALGRVTNHVVHNSPCPVLVRR